MNRNATNPQSITFGTVVFGARRDGFGVLVADSFAAQIRTDDLAHLEPAQHEKIFVHPALPLAIAAAGMGVIEQRTIVDHLMDLLGKDGAHILSMDVLMPRLVDYFQPLIEHAAVNSAWGEFDITGTDFVILYVHARQSHLGILKIHDQTDLDHGVAGDSETPIFITPTTMPSEWEGGIHKALLAGDPGSPQDPPALIDAAREVVLAAIRHDTETNGVENRHSGEPLSVVLVANRHARRM